MRRNDKGRGAISTLMDYAGGYKWLTVIGCIVSALAMAANMVPYVCIWLVVRDLVAVAPNWGAADVIAGSGWAGACASCCWAGAACGTLTATSGWPAASPG